MSRASNSGKPEQQLAAMLGASGCSTFTDPKFARYLDSADPISHMRSHFAIPTVHSMTKVVEPTDGLYHGESSAGSSQPSQEILAKLLKEELNRQLDASSKVAKTASPRSGRLSPSSHTPPVRQTSLPRTTETSAHQTILSSRPQRRRTDSTSSEDSVDVRTATQVRQELAAAVASEDDESTPATASGLNKAPARNGHMQPARSDQLSPEEQRSRVIRSAHRENIPIPNENELIVYLAGNSLGLQSRASADRMSREQSVWHDKAVTGWFNHTYKAPWTGAAERLAPMIGGLIGAKDSEVATMGTLTANLHMLLCAFYRPTDKRYKIMFEKKAFPSDHYAFASQAEMHSRDISDALVVVGPRDGEYTLRTEDILERIDKEGDQVAVVFFSGLNYFSGQVFEMEKITAAAQKKGCLVGWDLAHAIGNVPLKLHDWNADFAVWCTYKYLNSGPGGIGGLFVHERHANRPRLSGWWGNSLDTRFTMAEKFDPAPGAAGFVTSTPSILNLASLHGSLETMLAIGKEDAAQQEVPPTTAIALSKLRKKSMSLTCYLSLLLRSSSFYVPLKDISAFEEEQHKIRQEAQHSRNNANDNENEVSSSPIKISKSQTRWKPAFTIITPDDPQHRGAQLSVLLLPRNYGMLAPTNDLLQQAGVYGDEREPDVMRFAPVPLYNTFRECWVAAKALEWALKNSARYLNKQGR